MAFLDLYRATSTCLKIHDVSLFKAARKKLSSADLEEVKHSALLKRQQEVLDYQNF